MEKFKKGKAALSSNVLDFVEKAEAHTNEESAEMDEKSQIEEHGTITWSGRRTELMSQRSESKGYCVLVRRISQHEVAHNPRWLTTVSNLRSD